MICARPHCNEAESRINGYCSVYCRDLDEMRQERDEERERRKEAERLRIAGLERIEALEGAISSVTVSMDPDDPLAIELRSALTPPHQPPEGIPDEEFIGPADGGRAKAQLSDQPPEGERPIDG